MSNKSRNALKILLDKGFKEFRRRFAESFRRQRERQNYQKWIAQRELPARNAADFRQMIDDFPRRPLISVILPVYNIEEKWLRLCIESVIDQIYEDWELCIADDASPAPHVRRVLEEYARRDARIKTIFRAANGHISAASNSALELASGEFAALLDHDDELAPDALFWVAREINHFAEADFIYSDEDMIDENGRRFSPKFKPDFARDLFYSVNYVTHFAVYRTAILREIGGFRAGFEGSQDYDLALRVVRRTDEKRIRHIPKILYHWRAVRGSVALSSAEKPYAHERARAALREHLQSTGKPAKVERGVHELHRVRYELPANMPRVSLILSANISTENPVKSAQSFFAATDYQNLEILIVGAGHRPAAANIKTVSGENLSKAASLNQAVRQSAGEILCFADANLRPLSKDWLDELVSFAIQKEIGAVGAKILDAEEKIAGGGLITGFEGTVGVAHRGLPRAADGNLFRARVINNFSAVFAACFAVRREAFDEIGGFDAENLPESLFDADFCLRLREKNLRIVLTPYAELIEETRNNSSIKPGSDERVFFGRKWQSALENDPFYNPNLSLTGETFTIRL